MSATSLVMPRDAEIADVDALVRRSGTSFYWAMRLLPPPKRQAMFAVYAFCREVDDIADEPATIASKAARLAEWRRTIDELYRGHASQPLSRALQAPIAEYGLRREDFLAVIDGMEMDAAPSIRYADLAELELYCDRVAGAVGRLSVRVFGVPQPLGDELAYAQGQALQLTNILRDLREDAERDRLYLPADLLAAQGIEDNRDALAVLAHPGLAAVCTRLAALARERFAETRRLAQACDRRRVRPAVIMREVYQRTLTRLIARGWQRWAEPVSVSSAEKLWVALRYGLI